MGAYKIEYFLLGHVRGVGPISKYNADDCLNLGSNQWLLLLI